MTKMDTFTTSKFGNSLISDQRIGRVGRIAGSFRSPDLTPFNFFLWAFFKDRMYAQIVDLPKLRNWIYVTAGEVMSDILSRICLSYLRLSGCVSYLGLFAIPQIELNCLLNEKLKLSGYIFTCFKVAKSFWNNLYYIEQI